jgi:hypothetical protein
MHNTDEFTEEDYLHRKSGLQMPSRPPRTNSLDKFTYSKASPPVPHPQPNQYINNIKKKYDLSTPPSNPQSTQNPPTQDLPIGSPGLQVVDLPKINWAPNIQAIINNLQCVKKAEQDGSMISSLNQSGEMEKNIPQDILILKQNTIDLLRTKNGDLHAENQGLRDKLVRTKGQCAEKLEFEQEKAERIFLEIRSEKLELIKSYEGRINELLRENKRLTVELGSEHREQVFDKKVKNLENQKLKMQIEVRGYMDSKESLELAIHN